jgi:HemY protein
MTKLFIFLFTITIFSLAAMWFIENDGSIVVEWLGYKIQTSVAFAVLASVIIFVILTTILQFLLWLKNAPNAYKKSLIHKKRDHGLTALAAGFAAIAAGDTKQAGKQTKKAINCLGPEPITRLLEAQTAQLEGDMEQAKVHYTAMLESKETEIIAIKGLLLQAENDGDLKKAIFLAEKAVTLQPDSDWANKILLRLYKITKRWQQAEVVLSKAVKLKVIDKKSAQRTLALMSLAQCNQYLDNEDYELALKAAKKSYEILPSEVAIAVTYARLLDNADNKAKAIKILETSWKSEPHPNIIELYINIHHSESFEKLIKKLEKLMDIQKNFADGHIAIAKVAMLANNPIKARNHLKMALLIKETKVICKLMAEVEEMEGSSREIVKQWLQRAEISNVDSTWACNICGKATEIWTINCSNCQSFDSLKWTNVKENEYINNGNSLLFNAG